MVSYYTGLMCASAWYVVYIVLYWVNKDSPTYLSNQFQWRTLSPRQSCKKETNTAVGLLEGTSTQYLRSLAPKIKTRHLMVFGTKGGKVSLCAAVAVRRKAHASQPCPLRPVSRDIDRSQMPWIPTRAPFNRDLHQPAYSFSKSIKKDNNDGSWHLAAPQVAYKSLQLASLQS